MAVFKGASDLSETTETPIEDCNKFICNICIGKYRIPRYLTCGHTFCESCLLSSARAVERNKDLQGRVLRCPVCRRPNDLPVNGEVTLRWVQTFPLNSVIIQMMAALPQTPGEETEERICDACKEDGERVVGQEFCLDCKQVFCNDCVRCHRKFKATKDHKFVSMEDMKTGTSQADFLKKIGKCFKHPERDVEMYCKTHKTTVCLMCSTFEHGTCKLIEIVRNNTDYPASEKDLEELVMEMKIAVDHLELLQTMRQEVKSNVNTTLRDIREEIEPMRCKVVELMDDVVSHISEVTKEVELEKENDIDMAMSRVAKMKELVEQNIKFLNTVRKYGSERHKFATVYQIKQQFDETSKEIAEEDKKMKQIVCFLDVAKSMQTIMASKDLKNIATVKVKEADSDHNSFAFVLNEARAGPDSNVLVNADEHQVHPTICMCWPRFSRISVWEDGSLVFIDDANKEYLRLYKPGTRRNLAVKLDIEPGCAAQIDAARIAVGAADDNTITVVGVHRNELQVERTLQTRYKLRDIVALNNGQLMVGWADPPAFGMIDVTDESVAHVSYFNQDTTGQKFRPFQCLAVDQERQHVIIAGESDTDRVLSCFDFTGKPVFQYADKHMCRPRGVALDKWGNIYMFFHFGGILKLSPTGGLIVKIHEDVPGAISAVCSDVTGTGFWLTRDQGLKEVIIHLQMQKAVLAGQM